MIDERGHTCVISVLAELQNVYLNTENKLGPSQLGIALESFWSLWAVFFIANELYCKYPLFMSFVLMCSVVVDNK